MAMKIETSLWVFSKLFALIFIYNPVISGDISGNKVSVEIKVPWMEYPQLAKVVRHFSENINVLDAKIEDINDLEPEIKACPNRLCQTCHSQGVKRSASFCKPGTNTPVTCGAHKRDDMLPFESRRCKHANCTTTATYNFIGVKGVTYCASHKLPGMFNASQKKRMLAPSL